MEGLKAAGGAARSGARSPAADEANPPQAKVLETVPRAAWRRGSCVADGSSWKPGEIQEYLAKPRAIAALPG